MTSETIEGVRIITLNRPPLNALTCETLVDLTETLADADAANDCDAIVLTGANGCFSGGIDIKEVPQYSSEKRAATVEVITRLVAVGYGTDKPFVAALPGHAIGAGMIMALMADYRLAARGSGRMGLTEAAAGLPFPLGPLEVVKSELAPELARRFALSSETYPLEDPVFATVIDRYCDAQSLIREAVEEARRLADMSGFVQVKQQYRRDIRARLDVLTTQRDPLLDSA